MRDLKKHNCCVKRNEKYFCGVEDVYEMLLCYYYECGEHNARCAFRKKWNKCTCEEAVLDQKIEGL